jgi:3-hydroxyacyl-CoA dehydrogenase/3-hydroxy-2-methylbutyryl-CoA dehydrogenase
MNEELAQELVKEIGGGKTKGSLDWVKETGKEVGGVIAAAGVSTPAKVCELLCAFLSWDVS